MSTAHITTVISSLPMMVWGSANISSAATLGELLTAKRSDYIGTPEEFDQYVVADAIGFSQPYVSQIEKGHAENRIKKWPSKKQLALLKVYRFTDQEIKEIAQKFNLDLPGDIVLYPPAGTTTPVGGTPEVRAEVVTPNLLPEPRSLGRLVHIELLQAQGGTSGFHDDNRGSRGRRMVEIPEYLLNGNRVEDCKLVEIFGDSMACEDVRLSIPEGSSVVINIHDEPQTGDILAADLLFEDEWRRVLKIFDRKGHIVLHSYNDDYPPIPLREGMELHKVGVYVNHIGPGRQAMRQINKTRMGR